MTLSSPVRLLPLLLLASLRLCTPCSTRPLRLRATGPGRCIGTLRARTVSVYVQSAVLVSLRMSIVWYLSVLLTTTSNDLWALL